MKRLVALSLCLLLAVAATANAEMIVGVTEAGPIAVTANWDMATSGDYDIVDIYVSGLTDTATAIQIIEGAWSATGGQFYTYTGAASASAWKTRTGVDYVDTFSAMNFSGRVTTNSLWAREAGTTGNWSNLIKGNWNQNTDPAENLTTSTEDTDGDGLAENLIGRFLVSKGTSAIAFGGATSDKINYIFATGPKSVSTQFSVTIPEPSTLALLGCGLFGLLAYAWRKRK